MKYVLSFILGTIVFILSFHAPFLTTIAFFYRGVIFLLLTTAALGVLLGYAKWGRAEIAIILVLVFCINLVFFTHLPVTADRSITIYLLNLMNSERDKGLTTQELEDTFIESYVQEQDAIQKRLTEQMQLGTIVRQGETYKISPWGMRLIKIYGFVADLFGVDKMNMSQ